MRPRPVPFIRWVAAVRKHQRFPLLLNRLEKIIQTRADLRHLRNIFIQLVLSCNSLPTFISPKINGIWHIWYAPLFALQQILTKVALYGFRKELYEVWRKGRWSDKPPDLYYIYNWPVNQTFYCQFSQVATAGGLLLVQGTTLYMRHCSLGNHGAIYNTIISLTIIF